MKEHIKEIVLYTIVGLSALFIMGYSVHMFVGGLVSAELERRLVIGVCLLGLVVMAYMVWDVLRRRRAVGDRPARRD